MFVAPFDLAKFTRIASSNIDNYSIVHNTAMLTQGRIEVNTIGNIERQYKIHIIVTVGEFEIFFRQASLEWRDVDLDVIAVEFITQMVSLFFAKRNHKILQCVGARLESLFRVQEFKGIWRRTRVDSRGTFAEFIEINREADGCSHFIN